jgi:phosphopantetheinyl transferase
MVGNDVVDLRDPEADPGRLSDRFDERVFCAEERATLTDDSERRWKLWAAKEAAYKVAVKQDPATIFSPSRFRVCLENASEIGFVTWDSGGVPVHVCGGDGVVHAVAATNSNRLITGLRRLAPSSLGSEVQRSSQAVRSLAVEGLVTALGVDPCAIEIRKQGRLPEFFVAGVRAPTDLSLSHHGEIVGFACEILGVGTSSVSEPVPVRESTA